MDERVRKLANLLEDKQAKDIEIFEVGAAHPLFDNVIVASVDVNRNVEAILKEVKQLEKNKEIEVKFYDTKSPEWIIIDLYDILIHIFVKESREHYDVDSILEAYVSRNN